MVGWVYICGVYWHGMRVDECLKLIVWGCYVNSGSEWIVFVNPHTLSTAMGGAIARSCLACFNLDVLPRVSMSRHMLYYDVHI